MKKKIALMLATLTTVATMFTGCGSKDVAGNYVSEVKLVDFMSDDDVDMMSEIGMDLSDITIDIVLDLTEDKNFSLSFDTTDFKSDFSALVDANMDSIIDMGLEQSGVSREDVTDVVAQVMGYDTAEAFFEDMKSQMSSAMDSAYEELDDEMQDATVSGTYTVAKDTVVFVTTEGDEFGLDKGAINEDGSITINTEYDGNELALDFKLQ